MSESTSRSSAPEWAWIVLVFCMVAVAWWRGHTFGPSIAARIGVPLWPVVTGEAEPLDCDEAAYAYMGRRMNEGAVLYRDLAENKPPGGYWLYALATRLGGATEWAVRVFPIPIVLATMILVWSVGIQVASPGAACFAAILYGLLATDPYMYGNGAQLELPMNLLGVASLAALLRCRDGGSAGWAAMAGALVGAGTLVRQTVAVNLFVFACVCWLLDASRLPGRRRAQRVGALLGGFAFVVAAAGAVLVAQGAGGAAIENVFIAGAALVTDTPPPPHAPPFWMRWLTGNSDPRDGALPPPFGRTDWLVWWGTGTWPIWLAGGLGMVWASCVVATPARRMLVAWTLSAVAQVIAPRQFWAHYYLLPTPGIALLVALMLCDLAGRAWRAFHGGTTRAAIGAMLGVIVIAAAVVQTVSIQVRDYLMVPSAQLTARYKGGRQWIRLREIGRDLEARSKRVGEGGLFVWGWQSPLYLYAGLDAPTRHFFANDLVKAYAGRSHALVERWTTEIMEDLRRDPPLLIFTGDPPFPALRAFLAEHYVQSRVVPEAPVLWVKRERADLFDMRIRARVLRAMTREGPLSGGPGLGP